MGGRKGQESGDFSLHRTLSRFQSAPSSGQKAGEREGIFIQFLILTTMLICTSDSHNNPVVGFAAAQKGSVP